MLGRWGGATEQLTMNGLAVAPPLRCGSRGLKDAGGDGGAWKEFKDAASPEVGKRQRRGWKWGEAGGGE